MLKQLSIFTAAVIASTSAFALQTANTNYSMPGFYVGVQGGYGQVMPTDVNFANKSSDSGTDVGLYAGYDFNQYFGVEAGYHRYPDAKYQGTLFPSVNGSYSDNSIIYVAIVGMVPVNQQLDFYAKVGVGQAHSDLKNIEAINPSTLTYKTGNQTAVAGYGALGMGYKLNQNVEFNVEVNGVAPNVTNAVIPGMAGFDLGVNYLF